jgi:molecular chaperone DnaK
MDRMGAEDPAGFPAILARIGGREGDRVGQVALSNAELVELTYPPLDLRVTLRRITFESMIRSELDLVRQAIMAALAEARIDAKEVDRVLLTGGSAYIPAFRADLRGDVRRRPPRAAQRIHRRGARPRRPRAAALGRGVTTADYAVRWLEGIA